jgi:hypothetical protein
MKKVVCKSCGKVYKKIKAGEGIIYIRGEFCKECEII